MSSMSSKEALCTWERPAPHKWIFNKEEMKKTASQQDGMSREEELTYRQQAASFIQEMVDGLNFNVKDPRMKISQLGMCVANMHMHRFFYWHSFKKFDFRDIGAACIFLAGKSEESPRKLTHVVQVWRDKKQLKSPSSEAHRVECCQIIVQLESLILQTIAFELNVDLPHTYILKIMAKIDKKNSPDGYRKRMTSCAYYFATDVMCVMDWAIRYSAPTIAIAIVHLVASYADMKTDQLFPSESSTWYCEFDAEMTDEKLKDMENDFLRVYTNVSDVHFANRNKNSVLNIQKGNNGDHFSTRLDIKTVQDRIKENKSDSPGMADSSGRKYERPRGYVPKDEQTVERLNKERTYEEERRKRDYDRTVGRADNSSSNEKRARIDPLHNNFVTSSNHGNNRSSGGQPAQQPQQQQGSQFYSHHNSKSAQQLATLGKFPEKPLSPIVMQSKYEYTSSTVLTPPPKAPRIRSSSSSDMDLEDGEVE